jgi:hypothetical protein
MSKLDFMKIARPYSDSIKTLIKYKDVSVWLIPVAGAEQFRLMPLREPDMGKLFQGIVDDGLFNKVRTSGKCTDSFEDSLFINAGDLLAILEECQ